MKFSELAEQFLASKITTQHVKPSTAKQQSYSLRKFSDATGDLDLTEYSPAVCGEWQRKCLDKGLKPVSFNYQVGLVSQVFKWAIRMGYLEHYVRPLEGLRMRVNHNRHLARIGLTPTQRAQFQEALVRIPVEDHKTATCTLLMMHFTGMRMIEVLRLQTDQVILDHEHPHVDIRFASEVKSESSRRVVPLPAVMLDQFPVRELFGHARHMNGKTILTGARSKVSSDASNFIREVLGQDCGLTAYSLRHTYARMMNDAEVPLHFISELMGHRSESITRRVYSPQTEVKVLKKWVNHSYDQQVTIHPKV